MFYLQRNKRTYFNFGTYYNRYVIAIYLYWNQFSVLFLEDGFFIVFCSNYNLQDNPYKEFRFNIILYYVLLYNVYDNIWNNHRITLGINLNFVSKFLIKYYFC